MSRLDPGDLAAYWQKVREVAAANRSHPLIASAFHVRNVAEHFEAIPYLFVPVRDAWGTAHIWNMWEVQQKGTAACADAACAIAAAALELNRPVSLCFKLSRDGRSAHLTATVDGTEWDPYGWAWPRELAAPGRCFGGLELYP